LKKKINHADDRGTKKKSQQIQKQEKKAAERKLKSEAESDKKTEKKQKKRAETKTRKDGLHMVAPYTSRQLWIVSNELRFNSIKSLLLKIPLVGSKINLKDDDCSFSLIDKSGQEYWLESDRREYWVDALKKSKPKSCAIQQIQKFIQQKKKDPSQTREKKKNFSSR